MRKPNTTTAGNPFPQNKVSRVWEKALWISGIGTNEIKEDRCGARMRRGDYGDTNSRYGWEIDHIRPVSTGGKDEDSNLQPLQWQNNRHKGDDYPNWNCLIRY